MKKVQLSDAFAHAAQAYARSLVGPEPERLDQTEIDSLCDKLQARKLNTIPSVTLVDALVYHSLAWAPVVFAVSPKEATLVTQIGDSGTLDPGLDEDVWNRFVKENPPVIGDSSQAQAYGCLVRSLIELGRVDEACKAGERVNRTLTGRWRMSLTSIPRVLEFDSSGIISSP